MKCVCVYSGCVVTVERCARTSQTLHLPHHGFHPSSQGLPEPIESCLKEPDADHPKRVGMRRIILEAVAVNAVSTSDDVGRFVR